MDRRVKPQYCSLKDDTDDGGDFREGRGGLVTTDGKLAELALDGAGRASAAAGDDTLLEELIEHAIMKADPLLRGE